MIGIASSFSYLHFGNLSAAYIAVDSEDTGAGLVRDFDPAVNVAASMKEEYVVMLVVATGSLATASDCLV